jgi:hypothetical protein
MAAQNIRSTGGRLTPLTLARPSEVHASQSLRRARAEPPSPLYVRCHFWEPCGQGSRGRCPAQGPRRDGPYNVRNRRRDRPFRDKLSLGQPRDPLAPSRVISFGGSHGRTARLHALPSRSAAAVLSKNDQQHASKTCGPSQIVPPSHAGGNSLTTMRRTSQTMPGPQLGMSA